MSQSDDVDREKEIGAGGLAFFGAVTASVTHELNNVIGIIDQTAGLLQDFLAAAEAGNPIPPERLHKIAEKTRAQTSRGVAIIKRLNTFAHTTDEPIVEFELNETVQNLCNLMERLVGLKRAVLQYKPDVESVRLVGSPFLVQEAVFLSVKQILSVAQREDVVTLDVQKTESGASISVAGPAPDQIDVSYLEPLMNRCGGTVHSSTESGQVRFELAFPDGREFLDSGSTA